MVKKRVWLAAALGFTFPTLVVAQGVPLHLTPQQSAPLNRLAGEAQKAMMQVPEGGIESNNLMQLVRIYSELGEPERAHAVVQVIRKRYAAMSEANASGQNPRGAANPVMEPSVFASVVAESGDTMDALDIMQDIGSQDRSGMTLSTISTKQAQLGDTPGALQTAARIRSEGLREHTIGQIINFDLVNRDVSGALAAVGPMAPSPQKVQQLVAIAHVQLLTGDREAAARMVAEAQKTALQLPEQTPSGPQKFRVTYYNYCSPGPNDSVRDVALQFVAQGQWELGDHAAAMATRNQIQTPSLQDQTMLNIVKVGAEAKRFAEVVPLVEKLPEGSCRNEANAALARAEIVAGNVTEGMARASEIQPASSTTWSDLAMKAKDPAVAAQLFARARTAAANAPTELERAEDLYGIAALETLKPGLHEAYCQDSAEAIRLAREARAKGERRRPGVVGLMSSNPIFDSDYAEVRRLASCGDLAQAKAFALRQEGTSRENAIGNVAARQAENGDLQGAENWSNSLTSPTDRATALLGIIETALYQLRMQAQATPK